MSALWWPNSQPASMRTRSPSSTARSEEHTSELQSPCNLVCRLLLEKKILLEPDVPSADSHHSCHRNDARSAQRCAAAVFGCGKICACRDAGVVFAIGLSATM